MGVIKVSHAAESEALIFYIHTYECEAGVACKLFCICMRVYEFGY